MSQCHDCSAGRRAKQRIAARGRARGLAVAAVLVCWSGASARPIPQPRNREHDIWEGLDGVIGEGVDPDQLADEIEDLDDKSWEGKILSADPELAARLNVTGGTEAASSGGGSRVDLSFFALGSWGRPTPQLAAVARAMTARAASVRPMAVLTTGDNFCPAGVRSERDALWDEAYRRPFRRLREPFYATLGPCDYYGSAEAELAMRARRRDARWAMPARNYARTFRVGATSVLVAFLDTTPLALDRAVRESHEAGPEAAAALSRRLRALRGRAASQLDWLDRTLAASSATWRVVVGNYPVFSAGPGAGTRELVRDLLPRLRAGSADLYLAGRDAGQQHIRAEGIEMIVTAAGSGGAAAPLGPAPNLRFADAGAGFAELDFGPARMTARLVDSAGRVLHSFSRLARAGGGGGSSGSGGGGAVAAKAAHVGQPAAGGSGSGSGGAAEAEAAEAAALAAAAAGEVLGGAGPLRGNATPRQAKMGAAGTAGKPRLGPQRRRAHAQRRAAPRAHPA